MNIYIALFRGINVGGKNSLPMKELTAILKDLGCHNIRTYIQSGNAVFKSDETMAFRLSDKIIAEIKKRHGFKPAVLLLRSGELENVIANNPFREAETEHKALHAGFLASEPQNPDLKKLEQLKAESERFRLAGKVFYLHAPRGVGRSRLAAGAERLLGIPMTDRNWKTVRKIMDMAKELE